MEVTTVDTDSPGQWAGLVALLEAAHRADTPDRDPVDERALLAEVSLPVPGLDTVHRIATVDGEVAGYLVMAFPTVDNRHYASADITVHPRHRRRGIGSALLAEALDRAGGRGRRTLGMGALESGPWPGTPRRDPAGVRFLAAHGFTLGLRSINRRADLSALDYSGIDRRYAESMTASAEYETIAWHGRVPEELLEPLAVLRAAFLTQIPLGDFDLEAERIDADRLRAEDDESLAAGRFRCGVVARRAGDTAIVATTVIGKAGAAEEIAHQGMTMVAPEHRGHRLGMRVKIENLRQLRQHCPGVRRIDTSTADGNVHMIAINERLGFRPVDHLVECQRQL